MFTIKYRLKKVGKINFNTLCESIYLNACKKYPFLNENERAYVAGCILSRVLENYEPNVNAQNNVIAPSLTTGKGATGNLTPAGAFIASKKASETLGTPVSPAQIQDTDNTLKKLGIDPGLLASTLNARNNQNMSENTIRYKLKKKG